MAATSVAPVPTTTLSTTVSLTATEKYTTTPIKTVTPAPSHTTVISTSTSVTTTTVKGSTATYISTSTVSVTDTFTGSSVTTTDIITSTVTSATDTYTVPTVPGFTPLASESGYIAKKRSNLFVPRGQGAQPATRAVTGVKVAITNGHATCSPTLYPAAVICGELIEIVTTNTSVAAAATTSTTTLAASTSTSTITKSVTSTSTSLVGASTTSTTTVTTTMFTTVYPTTDVTSTTTVTYISASSTTYAACATNNLVSSANGGNGISIVAAVAGDSVGHSTVSGINDPYDCCVACQTYAGDCGGFIYAPGFCQLFTYTTCSPTTMDTQFGTNSDADGDGLTIGNGPCGQIANSATDGDNN